MIMTHSGKSLRYGTTGKLINRSEPVITRLMTDALAHPEILSLAAGFTDNAVLPKTLLAEALDSLGHEEPDNAYLQYGMNAGRLGLRTEILRMLSRYNESVFEELSASNVVVCNGSQQALYISAQLFCDSGDIVLVEQPSYFVFLELLQGLGIRPVSIPQRDDGCWDVAALSDKLESLGKCGELERVKFIYVMGVYANPSTRCRTEKEKNDLAGILRALPSPIPVIEDMAYRELHFNEPYPAKSVLSLPSWEGLPALYLGTFTKPFSTGMKVGFAISKDMEWLNNLSRVKGHHDFGTTHLNQALIETVLKADQYEPHLKVIQSHYSQKMEILDQVLDSGGMREMGWKWQRPEGGLLFWVEGPEGCDLRLGSDFHKNCLEAGVLYVPGDLSMAEGHPYNAVRLSFGALDKSKIELATSRFITAAKKLSR